MPKSALIFGVSGQDGSYLAEFLLGRGYSVAGAVRDGEGMENLAAARDRLVMERLADVPGGIERLVEKHAPCEVYNLAAQSHVGRSWDAPGETAEANLSFPARILAGIHRLGGAGIRFFQASSGSIFGGGGTEPKGEGAPRRPCDPYGVSKCAAHRLVELYREKYGYFLCSGILYNHESPRRPVSFVTRRITNAAARIKLGKQDGLALGSLDSVRDWGYAPDYVEGMWMMLQAERPDDYVLATGRGRTVGEFAEAAFSLAGLDWRERVVVDGSLTRPDDRPMVGDPSKAERELGWLARTPFEDMVKAMLENDIRVESETS